MKIISWNIRNLGNNKLGNPLTAPIAGFGLGNNVLEYVLNVVMGLPPWAHISSAVPADLFIIIELKSGGHNKSHNAFGTSIPTLATLVGAMNTVAANLGVAANYQYDAVPPLIIGHHETVGMIFNTRLLAWAGSAVQRDVNAHYINPRSPFTATFTENATGAPLVVTGIHAPPPTGAPAVRSRPPINYARTVSAAPMLLAAHQMVTGDYNCTPISTFINGAHVAVGWQWAGYHTHIPDGTLSSVRKRVANDVPAPGNYLSDAYDNLLYNFVPGAPAVQRVLDTIGNALDMTQAPPVGICPARPTALLNNFNRVSDHLPLYMEW